MKRFAVRVPWLNTPIRGVPAVVSHHVEVWTKDEPGSDGFKEMAKDVQGIVNACLRKAQDIITPKIDSSKLVTGLFEAICERFPDNDVRVESPALICEQQFSDQE